MGTSSSVLPSLAEVRAQEAQNLSAFSSLNLLSVRSAVRVLLQHIGRVGLFEQYTIHDISHIDKMLKIADWITPDATKTVMTPAEWLMVVLAIYFHDLGMVVTRADFEARNDSRFREFRKFVYRGEQGEDYRAKVRGFEAGERFLYQEFVRQHHAQRIKMWLSGEDSLAMCYAETWEIFNPQAWIRKDSSSMY